MPHHLRPSILKTLLRPCHGGWGPYLCAWKCLFSRDRNGSPGSRGRGPEFLEQGRRGQKCGPTPAPGGCEPWRAHIRMQVIAHFHLGQGTDESIF